MDHAEFAFISHLTAWESLMEYTEMNTLNHPEDIILNVKMKELSMMAKIPVKPTWHLIMANAEIYSKFQHPIFRLDMVLTAPVGQTVTIKVNGFKGVISTTLV